MNLENIRHDALEGIDAVEQLPEKTIDNKITGYSKYFSREQGYPISSIHIFCEDALSYVNIPEGSKDSSCSFASNTVEFIYKDVKYLFINNKKGNKVL